MIRRIEIEVTVDPLPVKLKTLHRSGETSSYQKRYNVLVLKRQITMPGKTKRSTLYLDEDLHKALRLKAAEVDASMSDIVNDALRAAFDEDASDIDAIRKRSRERSTSFGSFVTKLKSSGKL